MHLPSLLFFAATATSVGSATDSACAHKLPTGTPILIVAECSAGKVSQQIQHTNQYIRASFFSSFPPQLSRIQRKKVAIYSSVQHLSLSADAV